MVMMLFLALCAHFSYHRRHLCSPIGFTAADPLPLLPSRVYSPRQLRGAWRGLAQYTYDAGTDTSILPIFHMYPHKNPPFYPVLKLLLTLNFCGWRLELCLIIPNFVNATIFTLWRLKENVSASAIAMFTNGCSKNWSIGFFHCFGVPSFTAEVKSSRFSKNTAVESVRTQHTYFLLPR